MNTVLHTAQSKEIANKLVTLLTQAGIQGKLKPNSDGSFMVLVPESDIEEAHSILVENGF